MHYTSGPGALAAFTGASLVPGTGVLPALARGLLDAAGALFGLYLLAFVLMSLAGVVLRRRAGAGGSGPAPSGLVVLPPDDTVPAAGTR